MTQLTSELRKRNPSFKIIIDTMDFHFNEFFRKYEFTNDPEDLVVANEFIELEKALYKAADAVIVISEKEKLNIQQKIAGIKRFEIVPIVHQISNSNRPFDKRRNMCFVGHFGNPHNVDAVRYFIENIFQLILKRNPCSEFHIIGHSAEKYKKEFDSHNIKVIGSLRDLQKALSYYKLFVCPMTYGAGMKGKIAGAIAAGVPVVTTSVGAEGFPVTDSKDCFISDSPEEFAEKCTQCLNDPDLWHNFSTKSRMMLHENFSPLMISRRLRDIFNG
jgi:glycosyltransferase involved in cell wall biosynthesis